MYCYVVNSGHPITKFYYIKFYGHEVTNFRAPQKLTFFLKKKSGLVGTPVGPQCLDKKAPFFKKGK